MKPLLYVLGGVVGAFGTTLLLQGLCWANGVEPGELERGLFVMLSMFGGVGAFVGSVVALDGVDVRLPTLRLPWRSQPKQVRL